MCPQLETIVILEEGPSAPLPFRYEDEDTDEMLAACRSLRLYHVTESTLVPDPEHWPYLEMHISDGDGSREALRQDFPDVSYIVYLDDCIDCTPGRDAWRRYVPDRSPTMCVRCAKCRQDSSHPWAELAFYDMPFPPELVPPNYRRRS